MRYSAPNPAWRRGWQSWRPVGRVAELGSSALAKARRSLYKAPGKAHPQRNNRQDNPDEMKALKPHRRMRLKHFSLNPRHFSLQQC